MKRLPMLFLAFAASAHGADAPGTVRVAVPLAAGKVHEECARLAAGETRRWRWQSDAPVDFNVHYHQGKEVHFPVKQDASRGASGTFKAGLAQDFCWMWTGRAPSTRIEGRIEK